MNKMLLTLSIALIALLTLGSVYAYQSGNRFNSGIVNKTAAEDAINAGNYNAWKELHVNANGKMASAITASNFHLLKELHTAKELKDMERVKEIKAELGVNTGLGQGNGNGKHDGLGKGHNKGKNANCPMMDNDD